MKIDPTSINGPGSAPAGATPTGTARTENNRATGGASLDPVDGKSRDQVQISNLLEGLRRASTAEDEEITPERAAHLDKLAAEVQSGSYEVDAQELSKRIVEDTLNGIG